MHDTEFFKKLVENIVMWSFVIVIAALARRADGDGCVGGIKGR